MTYQMSRSQIEANARIAARRAEKGARLAAEAAAGQAPVVSPLAPSDDCAVTLLDPAPAPSSALSTDTPATPSPDTPPATAAPETVPARTLAHTIDDLPDDHARAPQQQFARADQVVFLERLSIGGSVRAASRVARVSHQTVYRLRRSCARFRAGWNAALLLARDHAEATLAENALHGVEEEVWYHGEAVGKRRRFDARLLLAHLARLDRLEEAPDASFHAGAFDEVLERIGADEDLPDRAAAAKADIEPVDGSHDFVSEPCNTRSMSRAEAGEGAQVTPDDGGPERSALYRLYAAMEDARPDRTPPPEVLGDPDAAEDCQIAAFESGDANWWRYGEDYVLYEADDDGDWHAAPDQADHDAYVDACAQACADASDEGRGDLNEGADDAGESDATKPGNGASGSGTSKRPS